MRSDSSVKSFLPETIVIGPNITVGIPAVAYQVAGILKYGSGGSLMIQGQTFLFNGVAQGSSYASAQTYLLGTSETINVGCMSGGITLTTVGATVTCYLLRGLNQII